MIQQVKLQAGRENSILFRHPWIFSRAIQKVPKGLQDGSLVTIVSHQDKVLGTGYFNSRSQIALRVLVFGKEVAIDQGFFEERFRQLQAYRERFLDLKQTNAYRLVFAESDGLPGLVVDRYGDFLVIQIHTLGMDKLKNVVVQALKKVFKPKGIYERSDLEVRKKEGLKNLPKGVLDGVQPADLCEIMEYGTRYFVDIAHGQKTGFFLDQRENRKALQAYAKGKSILNLFSYSGGFSLATLRGGAKKVTSVDISASALDLAKKNFTLNDFDPANHEFIVQDVFDYLEECIAQNRKFDVVVVDPPAFVKNKESLNHGVNAYIQLNTKALRVLKPGGIIASSSCSSYVSQEMFRTILFKSALQAHAEMVILESKIQPLDHPVNINFPEGEYLKFLISKVELV